jgi:hypothetical protein
MIIIDAGGAEEQPTGPLTVLVPICGWVEPKSAPHRTGPSCGPKSASNDDNPVTPVSPSCTRLPKCDDFNPKKTPPFAEAACTKQAAFYKLRVAEEARNCLLRLSGKEICDACSVHTCLDAALKHACLDPTADSVCVQILQKCPGVAMDECRDYLSGMKAEGRAKMLACMSNSTPTSGCGFGIYACAEGLGL